ncbi:hypothetical protein AFLA_001920 [Aspergillus flavus NRRL3357]|nr:hypothetical protein AFLA_001920 [Aspergillus flavus NRRL3357]
MKREFLPNGTFAIIILINLSQGTSKSAPGNARMPWVNRKSIYELSKTAVYFINRSTLLAYAYTTRFTEVFNSLSQLSKPHHDERTVQKHRPLSQPHYP